jgi:transcriptional regulator with XRE-family HTH domain
LKNRKEPYKAGLRRRFLAVFDEVKEANKLTDAAICRKIDMVPSIFAQIRAGDRGPTIEQIIRICDEYEYDLLYVIRGDDKVGGRKPSSKKVSLEDLHKEVQELKLLVEGLIKPMVEGTVHLVKKENPIDPKEWAKKLGKQ